MASRQDLPNNDAPRKGEVSPSAETWKPIGGPRQGACTRGGGMWLTPGYVYVLTNEHMPGLVKIGRTENDAKVRAKQLKTTGVPSPFTVAYTAFVPFANELERGVHEELSEYRVDGSEFFKASVDEARACIDRRAWSHMKTVTETFYPGTVPVPVNFDALWGVAYLANVDVFDLLRAVHLIPSDMAVELVKKHKSEALG